MNNSTLNMLNTALAELKEKQSKAPLSLVEMRQLKSLIESKKLLLETPELALDNQEIDEDLFTDEEILEFIKTRKVNEQDRLIKDESKTKKASAKKTSKANKKTTTEVFKG